LLANDLADQSKLFIFADGPKETATNEDLIKIKGVRNIIREKKWCKSVEIIESNKNKGLGNSIFEGVTNIVNRFGSIIVLEDDLITSKGFILYMNEALQLYKNDEKVMHITGTNYSSNLQKKLPTTFFTRYIETCGWGTWQRAWNFFINQPEHLYKELERRNLFFQFDCYGTSDFKIQLINNIDGTLNTWGIRWLASVFLKEGLVLQPRKSLVVNIGFDGTGDNCGVVNTQSSYWKEVAEYVKVERIPITESKIGKKHLKEFYKSYCGKETFSIKRFLSNSFYKIIRILTN